MRLRRGIRPVRTKLPILFTWVMTVISGTAQASEFESYTNSAREWYAAGEFAAAAELFREAYNIEPKGNLLYNIAHCYEKAGEADEGVRDKMFADAVLFYEKYLAAFPNTNMAEGVRRKVSELKSRMKPPTFVVSITTDPPGAQVFMDDRSAGTLGQTPLTVEVSAGPHRFIVEKQGFESQQVNVEKEAGERAILELILEEETSMGSLYLDVSPDDATLLIDGHKKGKSPFSEPFRLSAGRHVLLLMLDGHVPWRGEVEIRTDMEVTVEANLRRERDQSRESGQSTVWPWLTIGTGALSTIAASTLGVQAIKLYDRLEERRDQGQPVAQADISTGKSMVVGANILFGIGAAAIGGGVFWLLKPPDLAEEDYALDVDMGYEEDRPTLILRGSFE